MKYAIGLDVGISSIGYSVLELDGEDQPCRIEKLGSRMFDKAEDPKTGASLAVPRRDARGSRRRLRRHRHRLERIRRMIISHGILTNEQLSSLYDSKVPDIYETRTRALDELVSNEDFARILINLAQRRGYRSNRKSDKEEDKDGKVIFATAENQRRLQEGGYRTVGEMFHLSPVFSTHKRNTGDDYTSTVTRSSIESEAKLIFEAQRRMGATFADETVQEDYLKILLSQRSFAEGPACGPYSGNQVSRMRGFCTFEKQEQRAPKASYSFQLFNLWQLINHIRVERLGESRPLTAQEREAIFDLAHQKSGLTYTHVRKHLNIPTEYVFRGISYDKKAVKKAEDDKKLKLLEPYHKIKSCLKDAGLEISAELTHDDLDAIGEALSKNQSDDKIKEDLEQAGIRETVIDALLTLPNFSKFGHLSVKACKKIIPYLQNGETYDKACTLAGYNYKDDDKDANTFLPPLSADEKGITSPVVRRAVSQTIRVVNAIIREMGSSPVYVNVELARELSKDLDERRKIEKAQLENANKNDELMSSLLNEYKVLNPTGQDLIKMKLWQEQDGRCMYSGEPICIERLTEPGYVDVDHIVPYSICFDDRMANKVLVLSRENRQKGNRLPLSYLQGTKRDEFITRVTQSHLKLNKKSRLLKESISNESEWKQRNLQDTQHIASFLRRYLEMNLLFAPYDTDRKRHVMAVNGAITSYVRKRWGIKKVREDGDLHHAVDAVVIGCITQGMINRISRHSCYMETQCSPDTYVDNVTGEIISKFPAPWPLFLSELETRLTEDTQEMREQLYRANYPNYLDEDVSRVTAPFISRMSNHKSTGSAHEETVRSGKLIDSQRVISKVALKKLTLDANGEIKGYYNPDSDRLLYNALKARLAAHGGKGEQAFAEGEFYKPKSDGTNGPVVKKVKIVETATSTVRVQDQSGVAKNENMVRCDVFYVEGDGYYFVPVYVSDTVKDALPQYAPIAGKDADGLKKRKLMRDEDFVFSLYKNDLMSITSTREISLELVNKKSTLPKRLTIPAGEELKLYYEGMDTSTAFLTGSTHDNTYRIRSIGKTMKLIKKYSVDVLGNVRELPIEQRQDYTRRKRSKYPQNKV